MADEAGPEYRYRKFVFANPNDSGHAKRYTSRVNKKRFFANSGIGERHHFHTPAAAESLRADYETNGYVILVDFLEPVLIEEYRRIYERFLSGEIDTGRFRSDLGGHAGKRRADGRENIPQIMCPSRLLPGLAAGVLHARAARTAKLLLGDDMELDFDMLIDKPPFSDTPTPGHQDLAYWPDLPDRRAASFWVALDDADPDNGCMWFAAGSHRTPPRRHWAAGSGGGALECEFDESEASPVPLRAGSATIHGGGVLHYSRGNRTDRRRRAFILNYRPAAMIAVERARGFDHTNERQVRAQNAGESEVPFF